MPSTALPFQGIQSFLKSAINDPDRPFAFMGLTYDGSTTFRSGARLGPAAIRAASLFLCDGDHPEFGVDPSTLVTDRGDALVNHVGQEQALQQVERAVLDLLQAGQHPVLAGGDHLVTLGVLTALHRFYKREIAVIHFDAHCDTWADHFGDRIGHGTWVRNAVENRLVDAARSIQIGIRSPVDAQTKRWFADQGGSVVTAREASRLEPDEMIGLIKQKIGASSDEGRPVYVSFDIDALDPAYAPGTGTPELGGLLPQWCLEVLEGLRHLPLIGFDLVEVNPAYDQSQITALAAATLLWTYIGMRPMPVRNDRTA